MNFQDSYTVDSETSCWLWSRARTTKGYGELLFNGKMRYAHRVSLHLHNGFDLDSELNVLHKCDVPYCVNPDHLFTGSIADNNKDMLNKGRARGKFSGVTSCTKGHPFDLINTYIKPNGYRSCRQCKADRDRIYRPWRHKKELGLS